MYEQISRELMKFIQESPSCYHVIENFRAQLLSNGFIELKEENSWKLEKGKSYFVSRNESSIIAFKIPENDYKNFQIVASHSDSPSFKIKENEEMLVDNHYVELNVEKYGGMICAPWFDRPLSVAGKAIVKESSRFCTKLVHIDRDLLMIPNVAIHMNRQVNDGYSYNAQKDMIPLYGEESAKGSFRNLIAEELHVDAEDILGTDLFLYNRMPGTVWGADNEYISCTKLDDLQCAYSSMRSLINSENKNSILVCAVFDNEEVGSQTKQGAGSTMLRDTLERINDNLGKTTENYKMAIANSFMVSADNAHAVHPHHQDKADPTNRPYMNHGVVIKFNANQKYTTDSVSAALFKAICDKADVPYQYYINRSDIAGGSTLGNISNSHVSLNTIDIGLAQLSMHSPYETAGVKDTAYLVKALTEFYNTSILKAENESYYFE